MKFLLVPLAALIPSLTLAAENRADFIRDVRPLLEQYCHDCHDTATRKSGLDLEQFTDLGAVLHDRPAWGRVLEKIESHQMPPPKGDNQPTVAGRRQLTWFGGRAEFSQEGKTVS